MKPPLSYVPLLPVLASLAEGVLIFHFSDSAVFPLLLIASATALWFIKKEYPAALLCASTMGWCVAALNVPDDIPQECRQSGVIYQAEVESGIDTESGYEIRGKITGYISSVDSCLYSVRKTPAKIAIPGASLNVMYGDTVYFKGDYQEVIRNPDLPDEFNAANHSGKGYARFRVNGNEVEIAGNAIGIKRRLQEVRRKFGDEIILSGLSEGCTNFLLAALLGEGEWVSDSDRKLYAATGMSHILALSGAHVAIILSMLMIALVPFSAMRLHRTRSLIIMVLLWCYVVMTGGAASVTRAVIMSSMLLGARMIGRPYSGMNALCMVAILILLFTPDALFQPGFQLSFIAVASIALLSEPLNPLPKSRWRKPLMWIITPVAATLGTLGPMLYHFHLFPIYFIITSPVATLLLTLVLAGGIILIACGLANIPSTPVTGITDTLFDITHHYLGIAETLPESTVDNIYISAFTAVVLTSLPFALAAWIQYRKRMIAVGTLTVLAITLLMQYILRPHYPEKEMFILDNPYYLTMAVKSGDKLFLITNADKVQTPLLPRQFAATHGNYIGKRNITEIVAVDDTINRGDVARAGRLIMFLGIRFVLLDDEKLIYPSPYPTDYLLVAGGFRGDIAEAARVFNPKEIILARDLNELLRKRYADELRAIGREPIDLRHEGTIRILPTSVAGSTTE
ncbi:MAG: ComEC/Rec2 family competence protein [Muribaculaceae bacterium]|nr:ComEC/Rec2 family competence protein [Muribaculaceae bacterium]